MARPLAVGGDAILALARGASANSPGGSGSPANGPCPRAGSSGTASRRAPPPRRSACPTSAGGRSRWRITGAAGCSWSSPTRTAGPARSWRPTSSGCSDGAATTGSALILVARGDVEENRRKADEHGFEFPVVVQDRWKLSKEYGIFAVPVAFLIDEDGVIARDVARGVDEILALAPQGLAAGQA